MTSSGLTIFNYTAENKTYSEKDWIPIEKASSPYQKSKILSEKAAWDFYESHKKSGDKCFEMATVIPVWVLGPALSAASGASVTRFSKVFDKSVEKVDNMWTGVCDVRDVAQAHVRAAQLDEAVGERILVVSSTKLVSTVMWTGILRDAGYSIAQVDDKAQNPNNELARFDDSKMRNILKMEPTELKKTVLDMAKSLIDHQVIKI